MRLILTAVGRMKKGPEQELCSRYLDRARASARQAGFTGVEIREFAESQARDAVGRMADEARMILDAVPSGSRLVLLDERGKSLTSKTFADDMVQARETAAAYVIALGGPDGHGADLRSKANSVISFGAMTWPHQLARIMAAEQMYRAITILNGHPYHRE